MDTSKNIYCATLKIYKALLNWKQRLLKEKVAIWSTLTPSIDTSTLILIQNDVTSKQLFSPDYTTLLQFHTNSK